jgi:hypothetical protein
MSYQPQVFNVVVWLNRTSQFDEAKTELLSIAQQKPFESFDDGSSVRFIWGFCAAPEAETFAAVFDHLPNRFGAIVMVQNPLS